MRTKPLAALLGAAFLCLLMGAATRRWELMALVLPLILYPYLAYLILPTLRPAFSVNRELSAGQVMEDEEVEIALRITNRGAPVRYATLEDPLPQGAELVKGRNAFPLSLGTGEGALFHYRLRFAKRGHYEFASVHFAFSDPSLLFMHRMDLECGGVVRVLPLVEELRRSRLEPSQVRMDAGNVPSKLLGPGYEFYCLRDYASGDEIRRINWKASARRDRMLTNDMQTERSGDIVIVLDARFDLPGTGQRRMVDLQVDAAASITSHLLKQRNRVGMVLLGDAIDVVPLAYGRRQFYRVVDALLRLNPGGPRSTQGIKRALERYFSKGTMVILVTPLEDRQSVLIVEELSRLGRELLVVSPSGLEAEAKGIEDEGIRELVLAVAQIGRDDTIAELRRYCPVVAWNVDAPLAQYLMGVRRLLKRTG